MERGAFKLDKELLLKPLFVFCDIRLKSSFVRHRGEGRGGWWVFILTNSTTLLPPIEKKPANAGLKKIDHIFQET